MTTPTDISEALALMMRIASGEQGAHAEPSGTDDDLAALVLGLNMLAEELDHERAARIAAEQLLVDERDAYDRSPALLCSVDVATMTILRANESLATALGVGRDELVGRPINALFADRDREAAKRMLRAAAAGSTAVLPELALAHTPELRVTTTATLSDEGTRLRIVWRDVTRERQLEGQLLQAQKLQAVGRLSGGIAHDFNNILAIIMASASFVRAAISATAPAQQDVTLIEQAAQRAAGLTSQLLAFSRQQIVRPQPVDVGAHVRDVERMLARLISESIELAVVIEHEELVARIDPSQLTQVLLNLVVNARDAVADHGRILIEVARVELDEKYTDTHLSIAPGVYVRISVTDNGAGMPPDVLAQVFEPFFTTKPVGEGSGLGLSVCYGVVNQAGGHIWAYSEVGRGTTIKVYLPLSGGATATAVEQTRTAPHGHETILLVEDDAALRQLTARLLERAGYQVLAVGNGLEALAQLAADAVIDLLVTDVVMPKMSGRDLAEQLLREHRVRGVLYVSGYTANGIVHNGELDEGVAFLPKPFTSDQLLRAVRTSLDRKS